MEKPPITDEMIQQAFQARKNTHPSWLLPSTITAIDRINQGLPPLDEPTIQSMTESIPENQVQTKVGDVVFSGETIPRVQGDDYIHVTVLRPPDDRPTKYHIGDGAGIDVDLTHVQIEEIKVGKGRLRSVAQRALKFLTGVQVKALEFVGRNEYSRPIKMYEDAYGDYIDLIETYNQKMGTKVKPDVKIDNWYKYYNTNKSTMPKEKLLEDTEDAFATILFQPMSRLEGFMKSREPEEHIRFVTKKLKIHPNKNFTEQVFEKLMTTSDLRQLLTDLEVEDIDGKLPTLKEDILHAHLLALSLYDKAAWREFIKIMMSDAASRFGTDAGIKLQNPESWNPIAFCQDVQNAYTKVLSDGILMEFPRKYLKPQDGDDAIEETKTIPMMIPMTMKRNGEGLQLTFPPKVGIEYHTNGHTHRFGDQKDLTAIVQVIEMDDTVEAPGSMMKFLNQHDQMKATNALMKNLPAPLTVRIVKYKNGEIYTKLVSDHTVIDGVPAAQMQARAMQRIKWGEHAQIPYLSTQYTTHKFDEKEAIIKSLPGYDAENELAPYTEMAGCVPVRSLVALRGLLHQIREDKMPFPVRVIDTKGRNVQTEELFRLGTLITLVHGRKMQAMASEYDIARSESFGGLAAKKGIFDQLMEVTLSDFSLPNNMNEWISEAKPGRLVFIADVIDTLTEMREAMMTIGSEYDATAAVRNVHSLPQILWGLNAEMANRPLNALTTATVGASMTSVTNERNIYCGPAAFSTAQDDVTTYSAVTENGLLPYKTKIGGQKNGRNQNWAAMLHNRYILKMYDWDASHTAYIDKLRDRLTALST